MKRNQKLLFMTVLCTMLFVIILDPRTGTSAALDAIIMCLRTVIPGVFPFLFLGSAMALMLTDYKLLPLEKLLHIPAGTSGYILIGLVCGYPVGAKTLQDAYRSGMIERDTASAMACFCNNASPAFMIGILASLFNAPGIGIVMWLIQAASSVLLAVILSSPNGKARACHEVQAFNIGAVMMRTLSAMASICGWVVLFRMVIAYAQAWIIHRLSVIGQVLFHGSLELTNGLLALPGIRSEAIRFVISGILLSFGGLCVYFQTRSVAPDISGKRYLYARLLHAALSSLLAAIASYFLFPGDVHALKSIPPLACVAIVGAALFRFNKKVVAIGGNLLYNTKKAKETAHAVQKKA